MAQSHKFTGSEKWCPRCQQMVPIAGFKLCSIEATGFQTLCHDCQPKHTPKYTLTLKVYDQLAEEQDGACAICKGTNFGKHGRMFDDRDLETGEIRGLLCNRCNSGLGHFRDNPTLLLNAVNYLQRRSK